QWLGQRWPSSTQHYFQILPTKLGRAYADADYFRRNVRTVDVLIDEQAVMSGAAAQGARGSTSTWDTGCAPILSTSSACIERPAPSAPFTDPSRPHWRRTWRASHI